MRHTSRGQVLPLWVVAITTTFVLMFMALNYGNVIRWQVRAQSAADAAAQAMLTVQTERWNMATEMLYASNIEEYRIRRLLNGIMLTVYNSGGCQPAGTCAATYAALRDAYLQSVNRYTNDVTEFNNIASYAAQIQTTADMNSLLAHMTKAAYCNSPTSTTVSTAGLDCGFTYTIAGLQARTGLQDIKYDAQGICIPGLGRVCTGSPNAQAADFTPMQVDVVACAVVPPIVPGFGVLNAQPYYAIGRAAATSVMFEEDWFEPGALYDTVRGPNVFFQPSEKYDPTAVTAGTYDWYLVNFGGNGATAYSAYNAFTQPVSVDEMSVRLGWWNAIPIKPFAASSTINLSTSCTSAS
jgi:Putative Flp pilus-assembly TadE/G-like